jgi:hypothetical protein
MFDLSERSGRKGIYVRGIVILRGLDQMWLGIICINTAQHSSAQGACTGVLGEMRPPVSTVVRMWLC